MLTDHFTWVWSMLGWCIVTLAGARLKASVRFPPLRGMYQGGTCKEHDIFFALLLFSARNTYIYFSHVDKLG